MMEVRVRPEVSLLMSAQHRRQWFRRLVKVRNMRGPDTWKNNLGLLGTFHIDFKNRN